MLPLIADYYSKFSWVQKLSATFTKDVISLLSFYFFSTWYSRGGHLWQWHTIHHQRVCHPVKVHYQEAMVSLGGRSRSSKSCSAECDEDRYSHKMDLYKLRATPLTVRYHWESICTTGCWKQISQSSWSLHTAVNQWRHFSKQDKTTVGIMLMPKRSHTCSQPSQSGGYLVVLFHPGLALITFIDYC